MATTLKKFNLNGEEVGKVDVLDALAEKNAESQLIKDYIVALRRNFRQWSANTKGRSEVNHTTRKPHPQKGGGRSRQGSLAAPHYKGGGRVFGPKPKFDQHVRINQREKREAILTLIADKIRNGKVAILDSTQMDEVKTKRVSNFLKICTSGKSVLILGEGAWQEVEQDGKKMKVSVPQKEHDNFKRSMRNIPKALFCHVADASGYDVMAHVDLVMTEKAFNELEQYAGGK